MHDFPTALRTWRHTRRLSQLDLACEADVSPRHLAFLETGRSRPSRGMVVRLAQLLGLPRGDQNGLLTLAGFAPQFPSLPLVACYRNDHQNPLTEVVARAAEETAAAFALNHGQAVARLPGSGLGG